MAKLVLQFEHKLRNWLNERQETRQFKNLGVILGRTRRCDNAVDDMVSDTQPNLHGGPWLGGNPVGCRYLIKDLKAVSDYIEKGLQKLCR